MSIVDKNFVSDKITNNQVYRQDENGKIIIEHEAVKYRWTHGATDLHLGDGLLIYANVNDGKGGNYGANKNPDLIYNWNTSDNQNEFQIKRGFGMTIEIENEWPIAVTKRCNINEI